MKPTEKKKCPKCGFLQPSNNVECLKCGVIFSKIRKETSAATVLISSIPYEEKGLLYIVLWPLAKAKKYCDLIYGMILNLIWDELLKGKTEFGQTAHLVAFFIVSTVSLLLHHFGEYEDLLIFGLLFIYCLDYHITSLKYKANKIHERLSLLKKENNVLELKRSGAKQEETYGFDLNMGEIDHIVLSGFDRLWGAFEHVVGRGWQIRVSMKNGVRMVVYENSDLNRAITQGKSLAKELKVPFRTDHGREDSGFDPKSPHPPADGKELLNHGVEIHKTGDRIIIEKKTRLKTLLPVFGNILEVSGFFLFLLILAGVLKRFGMILTFLIGPHMGWKLPYLHLDISFHGILGIFTPEMDWATVIEYSIAIGMILYRGLQLIRPVTISIDHHKLSVTVGSKKTGALKTGDLLPPLLLREPAPSIILSDRKRILKIDNLLNEAELLILIGEIKRTLSHLKDV